MAGEPLGFEAPLVALQKEIESLTGYPAEANKEEEAADEEAIEEEEPEPIFLTLLWQGPWPI